MNFPADNSFTAQQRFLATLGRFFLNIININSFYSTTKQSLDFGKPGIEQQFQDGVKKGFADPKVQQLFEANPLLQKGDFASRISAVMARHSTRLAEQAVESATLVFAHTVLDEVISECCRISFVARPDDWFPFLDEQKLKIGDLRKGNLPDLLKQKSWELIADLGRQSVLKRFDYLHKICVPKLNGKDLPTAWIKREQIETFDDLRHRVVHGQPFSKKKADVEAQVYFAKSVGFSVLMLLGQAHDLLNFKEEDVHEWRVRRWLVAMRRELPEIFELLEEMTGKN